MIQGTIDRFKHQKFRDIPHLNPGKPGSFDSWGEIKFATKKFSCSFLCGKFSMLPVAASVVVLNTDLWPYVDPGYHCHHIKILRNHSFHFFETKHSWQRLLKAVEVVASGETNNREMSYKSAISTLILFTSYSCFVSDMAFFFRYVIDDYSSEEIDLPPEFLGLALKWPDYCKRIYAGEEVFVVNGEFKKFEDMKLIITLLNSRQEARKLIEEPPKPLWNNPNLKKDPKGTEDAGLPFDGIFNELVNFLFWPQSMNVPLSYTGNNLVGANMYENMNQPGKGSGVLHEGKSNSVTIGIADEHVGLVIGRSGRNLMKIRQISGARIIISNRDDFISGTTDRKVTITGSQRAIRVAVDMIMRKVDWAVEHH